MVSYTNYWIIVFLEITIQGSAHLEDHITMKSNSLEIIVSDLVQSLPPSEECLAELVEAARGRLSDAAILDIIRRDSGLAMNLLRLANAPCYRDRQQPPVESIDAALEHLGVEPLIMLLASSYVKGYLRPESIVPSAWSRYEAHGREISQACTVLAKLLDLPDHEQKMYTAAGLTHDIGRSVIMIASHPESVDLISTAPEKMAGIIDDENAALGMNHCEIGDRIFANWHFSPIMREGIARHHTPMLDRDLSFPGGMIFVSHFVTMNDFTGEILCQMLPPELLEYLGLTREHLDEALHILIC